MAVTLLTSRNDKFSYGEDREIVISDGLLRDLFAAFALAGIMSGKDAGETNPRWAAAKAYDFSDAMLDQRAAGESQ